MCGGIMNQAAEIVAVNIEDEMKSSYLDYSMSVIIGRAIPDVRDGLKPVHRRILYAMLREGLLANKRFSKCAGVVGEVLKKYHPHGDSAVYDTLVRLAQEWNLRYPLINGQGNFGSIDGDSAAAYRYTEAKLHAIAEDLLADIDKETVDFSPNFDDTTLEPSVLPSRIPNLLINGSDGIAVGMATKIPPHNLGEILEGCLKLIDAPDTTVDELIEIIPGPDFPTGAFIYGKEGIKDAYSTGRGGIKLRAKAVIEPMARGDRESIVVTEIPYQVNKARLIERIADLVKDGKIEGISDIRDESDRDGMRIVMELKRNVVAGVVLNQLYKHTAMQNSYGIILLAIVGGQPKVINLKEALNLFIDHRKDVVTRRTTFELRKAKARAHILEGLKIAVENIDAVIALIKQSKEPAQAKASLIKKFKLSDIQAQAILDLRLHRLTGLERNKIIEEYQTILALIQSLEDILASDMKIFNIIKEEIYEIKEKYADKRRTELKLRTKELAVEDLIQEEEMIVTMSHRGFIKRNPISIYRAQRRGGRGKQGTSLRDEDFVVNLFVASTHDYVLVFTGSGKLYWLKVHEIPQVGRTAKGQSITNLINITTKDTIAAILPVREFSKGSYIVMTTQNGVIKKTDIMVFSKPRAGGIIATSIDTDDKLISVKLTDGQQEIFLTTRNGQAIRFNESDIRSMGRTARGVRAITLKNNDRVVGMEAISGDASILTVTEKGYGKRSPVAGYRSQSRGGSGLITIKVSDRNGPVVNGLQVTDQDDIMIVTDQGKVIRSSAKGVSTIGRNTQGVRLITLGNSERVASVAKLAENDTDDVK